MSHRKQTLIAHPSLLVILSAIITCGCMTSAVNTPAREEDVINPEMEGILKKILFGCAFLPGSCSQNTHLIKQWGDIPIKSIIPCAP